MCVCLLIALCRRAPQRNRTRSVYIHPPHQTTQTSHSQTSKNKPPGHPRHPRGAAGLPGAAHAGQPSHRPDVLARGAGVPVRVGMGYAGMDGWKGRMAGRYNLNHTHPHTPTIQNNHTHLKPTIPPKNTKSARVRARRFPALVNCTSIDVFHPWPREALVSVAEARWMSF